MLSATSSALNTAPVALSGAVTSVLATYGTGNPATSGTFLKNFGNGGSATAYQASGVLQKGGCDTGVTSYINDCYYLFLTGNETQMLGPGYTAAQARQRTEIYTPGTLYSAPDRPDSKRLTDWPRCRHRRWSELALHLEDLPQLDRHNGQLLPPLADPQPRAGKRSYRHF